MPHEDDQQAALHAYKTPISLVFRAYGLPVPSGSRRVMPIRRRDGSQTYRLIADRHVSDWIATVRAEAVRAMAADPPWPGPLRVMLEFYFPRPLKHYRGNKRGKPLRQDAPKYVSRRPDLDKLVRAVLDALTGVVWLDDAQVAHVIASKTYVDEGDGPHAYIEAQRL